MALPNVQPYGTFSRGKKTATAGTVIVQYVPPYRPQTGAPPGVGVPSAPVLPRGTPHVTSFAYLIGTTAHVLTILRPLNWTTFAADAAAAQAAVVLTADPGAFATKYNYPLPNAQTAPSTANNLIAAGDYVMYQATCGQWVVDTVASGSGTTPTLTASLPTGGVKAGGLVYFFGITTDTDPATNEAHQQMDIDAAASNTTRYTLQANDGLWAAYHEGDPLLLSSNNSTTAGTFELVAGHYLRH